MSASPGFTSNRVLYLAAQIDNDSSLDSISYLLYDQFTTALAAGSVNGTNAEPTGGARTVTDTNSKLSITGGKLSFATGGAAAGDPGIWYPGKDRVLGRILLDKFTPANATAQHRHGWARTSLAVPVGDTFTCNNVGSILGVDNNVNIPVIGVYVGATEYNLAIILRAAGAFFFIKGGAFTTWTLLWAATGDTTAVVYPCAIAQNTSSIQTADDIRIPTNLYIPVPLAYDTFTRANGALGSTETTGPDSQVLSALAWAFTTGIWTISTNTAIATPVLGTNAIVNGTFDADTDWTKGAGWSIAAGVAAGVTASSDLEQAVAPLTVGRWYRMVWTLSGFAAGTAQVVVGGKALKTHATNATFNETGRAGTTAFLMRGSGFTGSLDTISARLLSTAELFASVVVSTADVWVEAACTLSSVNSSTQVGVVVNLDSASNPQNFILCYLDGNGSVVLEECVAGTYTVKFTTAVTYSAGAKLAVVRDGTSCRVFYNNLAVSTVQTMTVNASLQHGIFSTISGNAVDNFLIMPRGTGNEYSTLDAY